MSSNFKYLLAMALAAGCGTSQNGGGRDGGPGGDKDLTFTFNEVDLAGTEDGGNPMPGPCGDNDPSCTDVGFGPGLGQPFPLPTDMPPDPNVSADGVGRDKNGYLGLDSSHASFDFMWLANSSDWTRGTVSKMNTKTVREVARYFTVTCSSLKTGSSQGCDGMNGCCAMDSFPQFQNRKNNQAQGPYQQVNLNTNDPSRTAVDFNGDVWVANRAFSGQSSATKIANDVGDCLDRNKNGKIDTSRDVNGDGIIQTDCNNDGVADDLANVKQVPCANGLAQEFYGLDDECILFTTNTNVPMKYGRPLSLGPGANDFGPSDAWAGTFMDGNFFRIDGTTGLLKDSTVCSNQPYGLAVDGSAIGWAPPLGQGKVCYFDTKAPKNIATVRDPNGGQMNGYGVSLDRDQNVWFGGFFGSVAYRYTPDRKNGFQGLGNGFWTKITNPGGNGGAGSTHRGIAVDSRTPNLYCAWLASDTGYIVQMPGSLLPLPNGMDVTVDGSAYPVAKVAGTTTIGVGVDRDQNIWGVSLSGSVATRIPVDVTCKMTAPDINSAPMGNNKCPAGDRCPYRDRMNGPEPSPYTYSDFTGFGLRNFTRPKGFYSYVQKGCIDGNGMANGVTSWIAVNYDADQPINTSITVRARSGNTPTPDLTWGAWTPDFKASPADLQNGMPLVPNGDMDHPANYLQVEFDFATTDKNQTPKLKSFDILYECKGGIG
jgi:hypothetical protein